MVLTGLASCCFLSKLIMPRKREA
eukprot:SAG31_NODE_22429_length_525_cov_1.936620_1_plen_23_part_10